MQKDTRWIKDLVRFLPLKSQFVLSGNIRDLQAYEIAPEIVTPQTFSNTLYRTLRDYGYFAVFIWDPLNGFHLIQLDDKPTVDAQQFFVELGLVYENGHAIAGVDVLNATFDRITNRVGEPIALIIDFASRIPLRTDNLTAQEHQLFTRALISSHNTLARPAGQNRKPFYNTIMWLVEKEGDLPDWFLINNPHIRHIPVSKPDNRARKALAPALLRGFSGASSLNVNVFEKYVDDFVNNTQDMLLLDLNAIATLAKVEQVPIHNVVDAIRRYKVGVTEDPWKKIDPKRIQDADQFITKRVMALLIISKI